MTARIVPYDQADKTRWNGLVEHDPNGWFWQTTCWLDYIACHPDHQNLSFAVEQDGVYRLVVPFFLQAGQIQMEGEPCLANVGELYDDLITCRAVARIHDLWQRHRWTRERFRHALPLQHFQQDAPRVASACPGWSDISWRTHWLPMPAQWGQVRDSYRPLITKAFRNHPVRRIDQDGDLRVVYAGDGLSAVQPLRPGPDAVMQALEQFHTLHRQARGHETRQVGTWAVMYDWLVAGHAKLVLIGDPPVAGAYFILYKRRAYYMSGASTEPNCQHAAVWGGILAVKAAGAHGVELGWHQRPWDDEKAGSIAFFKNGFGAASWWVHAIERSRP
jgi:hypothetical protein